MSSRCFLNFSVGVGAFVTGLSQISSIHSCNCCYGDRKKIGTASGVNHSSTVVDQEKFSRGWGGGFRTSDLNFNFNKQKKKDRQKKGKGDQALGKMTHL